MIFELWTYEIIHTAFWVNVALILADDEQHVSVHGHKGTWELISTTTTACASHFPRSPAIDFNKHVS